MNIQKHHNTPPTQKQIQFAYQKWTKQIYKLDLLSQSFSHELFKDLPTYKPGNRSLLAGARKCLLLSRQHVAQKLGVSGAAVRAFEMSELEGSISLETLHKSAEAMDCELILGLRHKSRLSYTAWIWSQLYPSALNHHWVKSRPPEAKGLALAAVSRDLYRSPEFRKNKGWIRNISNDDIPSP